MFGLTQKIQEKILNFLKKYDLTDKKHILLVGFSGGIDSACLLDVLSKLSQEYGFNVIAGHLNHNWRGEESKKEELAAKKFCEERNIAFYGETLPEGLPKTEEEARIQRYRFFNKLALQVNATAIITGHTLSDQVETVLYRIIKGTGISGLKGIPEIRSQELFPDIYRPMLEISREETTKYSEENNIQPNIDSSNFQEKYLRNKIRLSLIPELKTYNSAVENAILRLSSVAKDSEEIVEEYLKGIKDKVYLYDGVIGTKKFLELLANVQRRVIFDFLQSSLLLPTPLDTHISVSYQKVEEALNFIKENSHLKSGNTLSIADNLWLFVSNTEIRIIDRITADKTSKIIPLNLNGETFFPNLSLKVQVTEWKDEKPERFPKETDLTAYVDLNNVKKPLFLRTRRDGDRIQPFGMKEKTKLKKYLINKGIPEFERDKLLLLANEEEILWVAGIGMSELLRVNGIPTHKIELI